ncbi:MAG TPA: TonB-dependent receptor, partial [Burkholderiales bacterium]
AGKGLETPTFAELAYKSVSPVVNGLNFDLKPAESNNYEIGAKTYLGTSTRLNAAVFKTDTRNEIVVLINNQGRAVYQNADSSSRKGFELSVDTAFGGGFSGLLAYTYLDARFESSYLTCGASSACTVPNLTVAAGNKIPGVPANSVYGELGWSYIPLGLSTALEARWVDKVFTSDTNADSAPGLNDRQADAYTLVNWRIAFEQKLGGWKLGEFARVDNIFDEKYVGSVIVNASNGAYFEPAPGTNYTVGVSASYQF